MTGGELQVELLHAERLEEIAGAKSFFRSAGTEREAAGAGVGPRVPTADRSPTNTGLMNHHRQNRAIDIFHFPGFGRRAQPPSAALSLASPDNRARDSSLLLCA